MRRFAQPCFDHEYITPGCPDCGWIAVVDDGDLTSIPGAFELPCDVRLPPKTTIRAGCTLETLILAMRLNERPRHFSASVDTHAERGDSTEIEAPSLMDSAVGAAETHNLTPHPKGQTRSNKSRPVT